MADTVQVKVEGLAELKDKLLSLGPKIGRKGLRGANYAGALVLVEAAKRTTAFKDKTGALRSAIGAFRRPGSEFVAKHAVGVGKATRTYGYTTKNIRSGKAGKKYRAETKEGAVGRFLEFGTSRMAPHSWLRPALFQSVRNMVNEIGRSMAETIQRYSK